jgi:acetyl-CoA carboxylase biotin carboxyl carrier protein
MSSVVKTITAGNVWKVLVKPGDKVKEGDVLFIMEVMKTEVNHNSPVSGTVMAVHVTEGQEGLDPDMDAVEIGE